MIRVLHVVGNMKYGGIQSFIMNLYRNIDKDKIQFDFVVYDNNGEGYYDEIEKLGGEVFVFKSRRKGHIKYYSQWDSFIKKNGQKYSTIHIHVSSLTSIYPIISAKKYKIKNRIMHAHSTHQNGTIHNLLNKLNQHIVNKCATKLFACSTEAGKYVFGNRNEFECINNCIDALKYQFDEEVRKKIRGNFTMDENTLGIVHVGRFSAVKNHIFLIDIFNSITKQVDNAKLFLVGDGELRAEIENKVKTLNLSDKVIFLGNRTDINEILQAMDVFVFPSLYEGLPLSLIEAQASGIKIFASNRISDEVKITNLIQSISLSESPEKWAEIIFSSIEYDRCDMNKEIKDNDYDINKITEYLCTIYGGEKEDV